MTEPLSEALRSKLTERLHFYEDLGIRQFYSDRSAVGAETSAGAPSNVFSNDSVVTPTPPKETALPKTVRPSAPFAAPASQTTARISAKLDLPAAPASKPASLFEKPAKAANDTLSVIRADIGECTRCKLHSGRTKLVFGDGNPKAELVFVGEGPGRDEDLQGLPFVGRAGKLLTQMIEAMGLQRKEVYICNVVKCRPPENRTPEKDEVSTCSPFLLRQLNVIAPKVIVCLGSCAAQALLQTNRGISSFRGEWLEFHGHRLMATYHPAYLLRNPSAKGEVWKDLQKVMTVLGLQGKKGAAASPSS